MKNIRLFINCKNLDMLQAFSDEVYLYDYIVNNYSELPEENIFRNPTLVKRIEEMIYFSKNNISNDDVIVWNETSRDLKSKNVSFYAVILDPENGSFTIYDNLKASIPYLQINSNTSVFEFMQYFSLYIWRVIFNSPKLKRENFGELSVSSCEKG